MEPLPLYRVVTPFAAVGLFALFCAVRNIPRFRLALLGIALLAGYGMLQDQVSARLCPEYFTVFHNPIPGVADPTLLGVLWGFLGAWWGGLIMGYAAGLTATLGTKNPPLGACELVWPMAAVVAGTAAVTALCGVSVHIHAEAMQVQLPAYFERDVPAERHRGLLVVSCYHLAAYAAAVVGSLLLCGWVAAERHRRGRATDRAAGAV
jgi:hypothetical protein